MCSAKGCMSWVVPSELFDDLVFLSVAAISFLPELGSKINTRNAKKNLVVLLSPVLNVFSTYPVSRSARVTYPLSTCGRLRRPMTTRARMLKPRNASDTKNRIWSGSPRSVENIKYAEPACNEIATGTAMNKASGERSESQRSRCSWR